MSRNDTEIRKTKCSVCGIEYDETIATVLGSRFSLGGGKCDVCRKRLRKEEDEREEAARLLEIATKRREIREASGMPPKFINAEFGTFEKERQPKAYKKCLEYAEGYSLENYRGYHSLALFSESSWGVGKTHLACAVANHIINKWDGKPWARPVFFTNEPDYFRRIRATYNFSAEQKATRQTEEEITNELKYAPFLILDDVGKEDVADPRFVQRHLYNIIEYRYSHELPMILTANGSVNELMSHLGGSRSNDASFDRLVEMVKGKFIQMDGESYRRK